MMVSANTYFAPGEQAGKTFLITGANSGIGLSTARALARSGARVLLGCRDPARAARALEDVGALASGDAPRAMPLDLASLDSVRACAAEVLETEPTLDVLMLNAGVMAMPRGRTVDGFEIHLGTNHLGHFALAGLLAGRLLEAPAPRVVTTASLSHWWGRVRWNDLGWTGGFYSATLVYGQSKLANLLFMRELAARARGTGLVSVAAHPGSAYTNLATQNDSRIVQAVYGVLRKHTTQPAEQAALPQLHAATRPDVPNGSYWGPNGPLEIHGTAPAPARLSMRARDADAARRLWALSEELTGVGWSDLLPSERPTVSISPEPIR